MDQKAVVQHYARIRFEVFIVEKSIDLDAADLRLREDSLSKKLSEGGDDNAKINRSSRDHRPHHKSACRFRGQRSGAAERKRGHRGCDDSHCATNWNLAAVQPAAFDAKIESHE